MGVTNTPSRPGSIKCTNTVSELIQFSWGVRTLQGKATTTRNTGEIGTTRELIIDLVYPRLKFFSDTHNV
jgi:hypothetical protein